MKSKLLLLLCLILTMAGKANAAYVLDQELTWDQVKGGTTAFALVSGSEVLYGSDAQNTAMAAQATALNAGGACVWKVETSGSNYFFHSYTASGTGYTVYGTAGYLNAQSSATGVSFILGKTGTSENPHTNGQDIDNGAVWTVTSTTGGYYIKNVGNSAYLNGQNTSASADKVWKFYSIKEGSSTSTNIATNSSYPMGAIRQKGNQLVMVDDESKAVVLHGVMDTPSAYFQAGRWTNGVKWADYSLESSRTNCRAYFTKVFEAINTPSKGTYSNLFRLHLDPCWLQGSTLATGFTKATDGTITDPHGSTVSGEANIGYFDKSKFEARLQDLYIPIIKDAIAHGQYVIVRPPGVFPQEIVVGDYYNEYLKTIWDIVSKDSYIKANAGYISLELGNEPVHIWGASADRTQEYWQYGNNHTDLYDFFQPIVNIIRNNGFDGIIWAPGTAYQAEYRGYSYKMLSDPKSNLGFAAHFYPGWYNTTSNDATCANTDANVLSTFKTQIPVQANYPIVITEVDWSPKDGAGGHYDEHGDWVVSNYGTWGTGSTTQNSRFGEQFKYVTDQCGNISYTIEGADLYVDMDKYLEDQTIQPSFLAKAHANNVDIYEACSGAAFKWYKQYVNGAYEWTDTYTPSSDIDLTKDMFHNWTAADATGTIVNETVYPVYTLNESTDMVYGYSTVAYKGYADLSEYGKLVIETSAGTPRCLFDRVTDGGTVQAETPRDSKYQTVDGTTYTIDLQAIVADYGFAHLHAIKGSNGNVTVTSMKLIPVDKCLKVTTTEAKTNAWDWQIRYPLPTALETGKTYTIEMVAKAGASVDIQPIAADNDSENKDSYGGSADIQYLSASITTDWSTVSFETNGNYPYDYLYFNIGKVNGDLMISNIKITEKSSGTVILDNSMNDNSTWTKTQSELTLATVSVDQSASGGESGGSSSSSGFDLTKQDDSTASTSKCSITQSNGVTTYTTVSSNNSILFKNLNVDVTGYTQFKITFEEETDYELIFSNGTTNKTISAHSKSFTYDIPSGTTSLNEMTLIYIGGGDAGKTFKISSAEFLNDDSNTKTITVDGTSRSYYLYIPDCVGENPALVFSLHGASGHSSDFSPFGKSEAAAKKCIVVYPQGLDQYFAVFGGNVPGWNATGENNEDIKFFKAILNDVKNYHAYNAKKVYCCGFSNGGMMTYAAANAASDVFAAFAAISGFPMNEFHHRHAGTSPRPFLHIQGKEDGFVKYEYMPYIRDNMVARLGANPIATTTTVTGKYTKNVYAAGTNGFPYVYYEIEGMGHSGYTSYTEDNNSTLTMWNFFNQYTLDDACDATLKWNPNLDANGFTPADHGWTVTDNKTFKYGDATPTANPNVSHSLQFAAGDYQLRFQTTGTAGNKITINLKNVDGTEVFTKEATVGQKQYISYNIPSYGEYTITITKASASDKFTTLGAYMTTDAWTGATEVGEEGSSTETPAETNIYKLGTTLTWDEVKTGQKSFALVQNGYVLCNTSDGLRAIQVENLTSSDAFLFKAEEGTGSLAGNYYLNLFDNSEASKGYVNASVWSHAFLSEGKNSQNGEYTNGMLWTLAEVSSGKYSIRNLGVSQGNYNYNTDGTASEDKSSQGYLTVTTEGYWANHAQWTNSTASEWQLYTLTPTSSTADPNFHIYLCFGQSNMEGNATPEDVDKQNVPERFKMMAAVDWTDGTRTKGNWYTATPPLCRQGTGLTPADYFGRTMVERLPENVTVGVINVAVGGAPIELFDEDVISASGYWDDKADWYKNYCAQYDNNPFRRLINMAKEAQKVGVIKGILLHQGESNNGQATWPSKVKTVYDRICSELGLTPENTPLLAGEMVQQDMGGVCYAHNAVIAKLPETISNSYVISSANLPCVQVEGNNGLHFTAAGYRTLGKRYANKMCDILGITYTDGETVPETPTETIPLKAMFKTWTAADATGTATGTAECAYVIGESTGMPYGDGNVYYLNYADLSKYGKLAVTTTAGAPRFLFNRDENNGQDPDHLINIPNNSDQTAAYQTVVDNGDNTKTYYIDLTKIVEDKGYAHLHAIKGANYTDVTVSSIELLAAGPIDLAFTEEGSKAFDSRYFQVSGEGVTYDMTTGVVNASQAGGKIYVLFNNADLSTAKSAVLSVETNDPYSDICNTGSIYNEGTSINAWYGSRYNMQNLDQTANINGTDQNYIWNEKMGSVTKFEWNISKAGMMKINSLTITGGAPAPAEPTTLTLTDGTNYTNTEQKQYDELKYTRNFTHTKWNALCVPFAINVADYLDQFDIAEIFNFSPVSDTNGNGYIDENDDVKLILSKKQSGITKPGKPYLIRPKTAGTLTITAADGVLHPANVGFVRCATTKTIYTITGLYSSVEATPQNNYYYVTGDGMIGHRTTSAATLKANRWYMSLTSNNNYDDSSQATAKASLDIVVIGEDLNETTAISLVNGNTPADNEAIYTLQGVKVSTENQLPAGIYIKNGRKFIIK